MPHSQDHSAELDEILGRLPNEEEKASAMVTFLDRFGGRDAPLVRYNSPGINASHIDRVDMPIPDEVIRGLMAKHGITSMGYMEATHRKNATVDFSLNGAPCAHVNLKRRFLCPNDGTLICSACRLVHYCSKVREYS